MSTPSSWIISNLDDVVVIRDDLRKPVNSDERASRVGPYPDYGATGQVGWIDGYLMDGDYILLGEDGAPFLDPSKDKAYRVVGKSWVNNHAHVLHGEDGVLDNRYLLHALNNTDYRQFANGTTRLKLTQGTVRLRQRTLIDLSSNGSSPIRTGSDNRPLASLLLTSTLLKSRK